MRHAAKFLCVLGVGALVVAGCGGDDGGMEPTDDAGGPGEDAGGTTGDGGGTSDGSTAAATWTQVWGILDGKGCNMPTCHGAATQGNLDLSAKQTAYDALVGVEASGLMCSDSGLTLVQANNPGQSLLVLKVEEKAGMGDTCGVGMPNTGQALGNDEIDTIRSWIAAGAPNN